MTRAAPRRAPLRRWEWRLVAPTQGAPHFRTRTARWDPGRPSLATCRSAQSTQRRHSSSTIERRGRRTPDIRGRALRLGPTLAPLSAKLPVPVAEESGYAGSLYHLELGHAVVRKGFERQGRERFHGPTSARECRRTSIRLRRRRRSLGQRPVGLPEAGYAPRRP